MQDIVTQMSLLSVSTGDVPTTPTFFQGGTLLGQRAAGGLRAGLQRLDKPNESESQELHWSSDHRDS